jgi:heterodisulfide reductase subunit C
MAANRGPLRFIVLNASGQDVGDCSQCENCDCQYASAWDLAPHEIIRLVRNNDERALACRTIWVCQDCQECYINCPNNIDFGALAYALRLEAEKRGIVQPAGAAEPKDRSRT